MQIYRIVFESDSRLARIEKSSFIDCLAVAIPRMDSLDAEKSRKIQRSEEIRKVEQNKSVRLPLDLCDTRAIDAINGFQPN